ncbi:MAG TPA: tetratricopeptide repeat protein [Thermoanaerobaculia bacterium]|nr:tetratricopeptide repeat protein [Thermoanaerobaculia bacterium]
MLALRAASILLATVSAAILGETRTSPAASCKVAGLALPASLSETMAAGPTAPLTDQDTILLARFDNRSGLTVLDGALDPVLRTALEESPFVNVLSGFRTAATLRELGQPSDAALTPEMTRDLCRRNRCRAYIVGSISRRATGFLIDLEGIDCLGGESLASAQAQARDEKDILDALGKAVGALRMRLGESPESVRESSTPLARATSSSFEALGAWGAARAAQQANADLAEGSQAALPLLEKAVALDPRFAGALFEIGLIHRNALQEARARDYLIRAFALRERGTRRERFRNAGMYYSFVTVEPERAIATFREWIRTYPRDERPVSNLGSFYGDVCRYPEAIAQFEKARQMNPANVIAHEDLIELLTATGQFDRAREAYREMRRMQLDDDSPHVFMYAVAALERDTAAMAEQAAWFDGKKELKHELLSEEADAEAYVGHLGRARALSREAVESAVNAGNREQAAAWQLNAAWREELFGNPREAHDLATHALEIAPDSREEGAIAAVLLARMGEVRKAGAMARDLEKRFAGHAVVETYWLPCIRAQIDLAGKRPTSALRRLEKARPYDALLPQVAFYSPMLSVVLRAEAYLALDRPNAASEEWRRIAQYPGIVQLSATAPISTVFLAQSLARQAQTDGSARARAREAYEGFLMLWKDADPDIPVLKEAQAELAGLKSPSPHNGAPHSKIERPRGKQSALSSLGS